MATTTRRANQSALSGPGEPVYEHQLHIEEDLTHTTIRNYLSNLRHFAAWCEFVWKQGREGEPFFIPGAVTTLTRIHRFGHRMARSMIRWILPCSMYEVREVISSRR